MYRTRTTLAVFTLLVASTTAAFAEDKPTLSGEWPQWRGPYRDGKSRETGLLQQWPEAGPKLVWETEGLGTGYSSVAIADGKIYTMGDREEAAYALCLDATNGKEVWATKIGPPRTKGYAGTRSTPTVDGDMVFVLGQQGDLVALESGTGKVVWSKNFGTDFGGKGSGNWGCSESPLVDGDTLVFTPGGSKATMVGADKRTGKVLWTALVPKASAGHSSIVIGEGAGVRQYVQLTAGGAIGVSTKEGKPLWTYGDDGKLSRNTANIPTPIVQGDYVFVTAGYGKGGALLNLLPDGAGGVKVEEVYYEQELRNRFGGVVLVDGYLYGDLDKKGQPWCAKFETGKIQWSLRDRKASKGSGTVAITYADNRLYFRYDNGIMALVVPTPKGYEEVSAFKIPHASGQSWSHPVVAEGRLYLREQNHLMCYDIKK